MRGIEALTSYGCRTPHWGHRPNRSVPPLKTPRLARVIVLLFVLGGCAGTAGTPLASSTGASATYSAPVSAAPDSKSPVSTPNGVGADGAPPDYTPTPDPPSATVSVSGWVAQASNGVLFLGWTQNGSSVSGTYSTAFLASGNTKVTTNNYAFQGVVSGTSVTLTIEGGFSGQAISGQFNGDSLVLSFPQTDGTMSTQTFHPGTTADYNTGVQAVQVSAAGLAAAASMDSASSASAAQQQQATNEADRAVDSAARALQSDLDPFVSDTQTLAEAVTSMNKDLAPQAADLEIEKKDAAKAAHDLKTEGKDGADVCNDANTVGTDSDTVGSDEGTVDNDGADYNTQSLTSDIAALQKDSTNLDQAQAAAPAYTTSESYPSAAIVASTLAAAEKALASWKSSVSDDHATAKKTTADGAAIALQAVAAGGC